MVKHREVRSRSRDSAHDSCTPHFPLCFTQCPVPKSPKTMVRVLRKDKDGPKSKEEKGTRERNKPRSSDKGEKGKEVFIQQLFGAEEPQVN